MRIKIKRVLILLLLLIFFIYIIFRIYNKYFYVPKYGGNVGLNSQIIFQVEVPYTPIAINAAQVDIRYDMEHLSLEKIEENKTFFKYILEKKNENSIGFARVSGGLPNPGMQKNNLRLVTFYFKPKKIGEAWVDYSPTGLVLANDGKATEVYKLKGRRVWKIKN